MIKDRSGLVKLSGVVAALGVAGIVVAMFGPTPLANCVNNEFVDTDCFASGAGSVPVTSGTNLLWNGGFEEPYKQISVNGITFPELNVPQAPAGVEAWHPFFCAFSYLPGDTCPAKFAGVRNPSDLKMGRPEYKPDVVRFQDGSAAGQWFLFYRVGDAGYYQQVSTPVGSTCTFSAKIHSWSSPGWDPWRDYNSHWTNEDGKVNSLFMVMVDPAGGENAFKADIIQTPWLGLDSATITSIDGIPIHYSEHMLRWVKVSLTWKATSPTSTVFIRNLRLFPFPFNDSYIDTAKVRCSVSAPAPTSVVPSATRTNTPPSTPTRTLTPTRTPTNTITPSSSPVGAIPTPSCSCGGPTQTPHIIVVTATPGSNVPPTPTRIPTGTNPPIDATPLGGDPIKYRVISGTGLNLRNGPFTTATVLVTLPYGTVVEYEGEKQFGWIRVRYNALVGWMFGTYLEEIIIPKP